MTWSNSLLMFRLFSFTGNCGYPSSDYCSPGRPRRLCCCPTKQYQWSGSVGVHLSIKNTEQDQWKTISLKNRNNTKVHWVLRSYSLPSPKRILYRPPKSPHFSDAKRIGFNKEAISWLPNPWQTQASNYPRPRELIRILLSHILSVKNVPGIIEEKRLKEILNKYAWLPFGRC